MHDLDVRVLIADPTGYEMLGDYVCVPIGAFSDWAEAPIVVRDSADAELGTGAMSKGGLLLNGACELSGELPDLFEDIDRYVIQVGSFEPVSYSLAELNESFWQVLIRPE